MTVSERQLLSQQVHTKLLHELVSGQLRPGQRLGETALAKRFGVSRTPIRDALQMLAVERLATRRNLSGCTVAAPDLTEVRDICEVRAALEAAAAAVMAQRAESSGVEALRIANDRLRSTALRRDLAMYMSHDFALHQTLLTHCGNNDLAVGGYGEAVIIRSYLAFRMHAAPPPPDDWQETTDAHDLIVKAIEMQDPETASAAVASHVWRSIWLPICYRLGETGREDMRAALDQRAVFPKSSQLSSLNLRLLQNPLDLTGGGAQ